MRESFVWRFFYGEGEESQDVEKEDSNGDRRLSRNDKRKFLLCG